MERGAAMWKVGDQVQKATGYNWPGIVVSVFTTLSGKARVVVECTDPEMAGALHIYSPEQLIAAERDASRCPAPGRKPAPWRQPKD
jgi:hypothetical protein